ALASDWSIKPVLLYQSFFLLGLGYSTLCGVGLGRRYVIPPGLSQSRVSLRSNGMRER
uniref:ABC transporter permease n=1 Tax=Mesocestoides corti TaxID=53468 RepID=A0A5K3G1C5_MESCO